MPTAVSSLNNPEEIITGVDGVNSVTEKYWQKLYTHPPAPDVPKPWLQTLLVTAVKMCIQQNPFVSPLLASPADFRAMLQKGNHRPAPGPNGREKWIIKNLLDNALALVLDLHNYIVMNVRFPGDLRDMSLTYMHKRGVHTNVSNWRGVMLSNFLMNSPMTWLNYNLAPYVSKLCIIPETQVTTNQGVQTRDIMSFLASVKCCMEWNHQMIYALQHDQMKGFDYLTPQRFYDAIDAYGLLPSIIDLDKAKITQRPLSKPHTE